VIGVGCRREKQGVTPWHIRYLKLEVKSVSKKDDEEINLAVSNLPKVAEMQLLVNDKIITKKKKKRNTFKNRRCGR